MWRAVLLGFLIVVPAVAEAQGAARGIFLAYSCVPGGVSTDAQGDGARNGLFTHHFLKALQGPGELQIDAVFNRTRTAVSGATKGRQLPMTVSMLEGDLAFKPGSGPRRIALVIGNSRYANAPLNFPGNDARDMSAVLGKLDYAVTMLVDANRRQMQSAVQAFNGELKAGSVGLFYYSGHGVQSRGRDYLIPVDARIEEENDIARDAIAVDEVVVPSDSFRDSLRIFVFDTNRNNPFAPSGR